MAAEAPDPALARAFAQAAAAYEAGRLADAEKALREILATHPDHADVLHLMALVALRADRPEDAVGHLERAVAAAPEAAEVWGLLGGAYRKTGRPEDAARAYGAAVERAPDRADFQYNLGNVLRALGRADDAVPHYQEAIALDPGFADAHYNLALALKEAGRLEDALAANRAVLALAPGDVDARVNLANVLRDLGEFGEAAGTFARLVELRPDSAEMHYSLAYVLYELERIEEAAAGFARALELDPDHVPSLRSLGVYHRELGQFREAEACCHKVMALRPDDPRGLLDIVGLKTFAEGDPDIARLQAFLDRPDLEDADVRSLHFGLAKALDDIGEYDEAFEHYKQGNDMVRRDRDPDVSAEIVQMSRIAEVFTPDVLARHREAGSDSRLPIFIVGMPRSGTTLTEQILASHPDVHGGGESPHFRDLVARSHLPGRPDIRYPHWVTDAQADAFRELGERHVAVLLAAAGGRPRATDKLPANFLHIGLVRIALPNAKVIHCRRDPVATCFSCYRQEFEQALDYSWDLGDLGRYYRAYDDLMKHWRAMLGDWFLDVRYEDLVEEPETGARRIVEFCGLPWDDACLAPHRTERRVLTASQAQVRHPIYTSAVDHWKAYEKHLAPLIAALGPLADRPDGAGSLDNGGSGG